MQGLTKATYGFHRLDSLARGNTAIHKMDPMTKTITTLIYVVIVVSFGKYDLSGLMPFVFYPVILMVISETPLKPLLTRMAIALPFCIFAGAANLIFDKETAFFIGSTSVSFGMISFFSIILKTILTVTAVLILAATTPMAQISKQFVRLKVPSLIVLLFSMIYRYINTALEETIGMYTAYRLRAPGEKAVKMKDMGAFTGQLFLRSADRSERIYAAMKCRGFSGDYDHIRSGIVPAGEWLYIFILTASLLVLRFFNVSIFIGGALS